MKRLILALAAATAGALCVATPAAATPAKPDCKTSVTHLVDRPDSGNHGTWALDTITRTVTICEVAPVVAQLAGVKVAARSVYKAEVTDEGTFVTLAGKSPEAGKPLCKGCHGRLKGGFTATFTAAAGFKGYLDVFGHKTFHGTQPAATGDWIVKLWGGPDLKLDTNLVGWRWLYWTCAKDAPEGQAALKAAAAGLLWVNAERGDVGDIFGCECAKPEHHPSPSHSPSPSASASASASSSASASASESTGGVAGGQPAESSSTAGQVVVKPAAQQTESLPVTGVNVGYLFGVALLLVGVGVGMFWAARRRREI